MPAALFLYLSTDLFSGGEENDIVHAERSAGILKGDQRHDRLQGVEADALNWSDEVFAQKFQAAFANRK